MTPVFDLLHLVSPGVADVLIASVWQGILLTAAVAICLRLVPGVTAAVRSVLWTAVLVLVVLLPVLSVVMPHRGVATGDVVHLANDWSLAVLFFWAALSVFRAGQLAVSAVRLWGLARRAEPVEVGEAVAPLLRAGSRRAVLCTSAEVDRPSVVGFFRPRVLLPPDLMQSLSGPELEQIVLHEMEHLRRHDDWTNLLQQVSLVVLPWNPAVLWLNRRLCFERELACDDGVLRATKARKAYAACLVRLAEDSMVRRGISLALGALGAFESKARESELVRRVRRILVGPELSVNRWVLRAGAGGVMAGALVMAGLLARSPRLVDFDAAPATVAAASVPATYGGAERMVGAGAVRPTLAKAVMGPKAASARMIPAAVVERRRAIVRRARVRTVAAPELMARTPSVQVPVWRGGVTRTTVTLTTFEVSQPMYAAVPWRDGWLILQL